jgi:hypothetical protein
MIALGVDRARAILTSCVHASTSRLHHCPFRTTPTLGEVDECLLQRGLVGELQGLSTPALDNVAD